MPIQTIFLIQDIQQIPTALFVMVETSDNKKSAEDTCFFPLLILVNAMFLPLVPIAPGMILMSCESAERLSVIIIAFMHVLLCVFVCACV